MDLREITVLFEGGVKNWFIWRIKNGGENLDSHQNPGSHISPGIRQINQLNHITQYI